MFGLAESGLAETLREAAGIPGFDGLEITTPTSRRVGDGHPIRTGQLRSPTCR